MFLPVCRSRDSNVADGVGGGRVVLRTGTAEDAGDLDELNGLLRGIHFDRVCDFSVGIFGGEKRLIEESGCVGLLCVVVRLRSGVGVGGLMEPAREISLGLWWVRIWGGASRGPAGGQLCLQG